MLENAVSLAEKNIDNAMRMTKILIDMGSMDVYKAKTLLL
jgi:hypothetical protein